MTYPTLPRVKRHGKQAWELVRRAKAFVLVDAGGDYLVDRGGWARRMGQGSSAGGDPAGPGKARQVVETEEI